MAGIGGYAGVVLKVDMSNGSLEEIKYDEKTLRKYLGGTALGAKILYDETPRNIEYDDPMNIVFIGTGPISGTSIGGSGSISIVTKGALTGGATSTQANGLFGAYMKFSGFDGIILLGESKDWKYLLLKEGEAKLLDASEITGLDTYEVTDKDGKTVTRTRQVRETEWWDLSGKHHHYYSGYLVSGSRGLSQRDADRIKPFHLAALKRYEPYFLAGWLSEEYSIQRDQALTICQEEFHRREQHNTAAHLPGDTQRNLRVDTQFS